MKRTAIALLTLATFTLSGLTGCITVPEEHQGAAKGAGIGAATGALAGAILAPEGAGLKGAVLGGLAGALVGGLIGNYTVDKKLSAEQTASKYNFQPSSGTMVRIENVTTTPTTVRPGDKIDIQTTYALLRRTTTARSPSPRRWKSATKATWSAIPRQRSPIPAAPIPPLSRSSCRPTPKRVPTG